MKLFHQVCFDTILKTKFRYCLIFLILYTYIKNNNNNKSSVRNPHISFISNEYI